MSGYDFKLYRWGKPYWTADPTRGGELTSDRYEFGFTVPDGMWVHECYRPVRESQVLGYPDTLDLGYKFAIQPYKDSLLFSTEPFLVVQVIYGEEPSDSPHGAYLHRARQVHKGELGQFVPVELPLVARDHWPQGSNRDRKRGDGWVRLTDAAEMSKMSIEQFVLDHWLFVEARDRSFYADVFKGVRIDMIQARDRDTIHKQVVAERYRRSPNRLEFERMLADNSTPWYEYWIRRGFARTVLLLNQFGWSKSKERQLLGESKLYAA